VPALEDDREELLAQELAKGGSQAVAYVNAGYSAKNSRVAASAANRLLKQRAYINDRATELKALARTQVLEGEFKADVTGLTRAYLEDRAQAKSLGQVSASIAALNGIVKLHGLGAEVQKHDITDSLGEFLKTVGGQPRLSK
jgi:hypothetical protein